MFLKKMSTKSFTVKEFRVYAEVFEQGLFFKDHIVNATENKVTIRIIKAQGNITHYTNSSIISLVRSQKKFDLLVSVIISSENKDYELPILLVEFSTAVKTDDHEWQRFDGMFWAEFYQIPFLKISSNEKESPTAKDNFGGGTKLSLFDEKYVLFQNGGFMFHINWDKSEDSNYLATHQEFHSCPPYREELEGILKEMINLIKKLSNPIDFLGEIRKYFGNVDTPKDIENIFPPTQSTRLNWNEEANQFIIKINRFGHAMDPERGGVAFFNMLTQAINNNCEIIAEFNLERSRITGKISYKSLFDGLSREKVLMKLVCEIFKNKNNTIDFNTALKIFILATTTQDLFVNKEINKTTINISNRSLSNFLQISKNSTIKNLLFYSDKIILTDKSRNEILSISWNKDIIKSYFKNLKINAYKFLTPLPLIKCKNNDLKEDIITYTCVQIIKKSEFSILAVSYPNAQGERGVLIGEGRKTKRKYIDIIAIKEKNSNFNVLLQENKDNLNKASVKKDIKKMVEIKENHIMKLHLLISKLYPLDNDIFEVYLGIGGKYRETINHSNIDYVMLIDLSNVEVNNQISWSIGLINLNLKEVFKPIITNKKLQGILVLPETLYIVKKGNKHKNQRSLFDFKK